MPSSTGEASCLFSLDWNCRVGEVILCRPRTEVGEKMGAVYPEGDSCMKLGWWLHPIWLLKHLGYDSWNFWLGWQIHHFDPLSIAAETGEMIATWLARSTFSRPAKIVAALSRTEGTAFSSALFPLNEGCVMWIWRVMVSDWGYERLDNS